MKGSAWVERVGCGVMGVLVCGVLAFIGGTLIMGGRDGARNAAAVAALKPLSAAELASAAPGQRVLAAGRIDPGAPVIERERGLVMYLRERCDMKYARRGRKSYTWRLAEQALPQFQLQVGGAPVPVLGRTYKFRRPTLEEPRDNDAGAIAYQGFKAGDLVVVDGSMRDGALRADLVFGGGYDAYVADLRSDAPSSWKHGAAALALAAVIAALAVWYIWRCGRAPAPAASTPETARA